MNAPKLQCTKNYGLFDEHEFNRPIHEDKILLESLMTRGFMPSNPIQVIKNGNGKLKIVRGHHRFNYARRLGLTVFYVVDDSATDPYEMEMSSKQRWSLVDFLHSRAASGDTECQYVLNFMEIHNLSAGAAVSILAGEAGGGGNYASAVKRGTYRVRDLAGAEAIVAVTDACRDVGVSFASSAAFVQAMAMVMRLEQFDPDLFVHKVRQNPSRASKRPSRFEYLDEIEALYNYGTRTDLRVPLAFLAKQAAHKRNATVASAMKKAAKKKGGGS